MADSTDLAPTPQIEALRHVHVRVGGCDIAIPIGQVRQALPLPPQGLTVLPRRTGGLIGLADVAGTAVPIVALERWVPLEVESGAAALQRLLVLQHAGRLIGIRVDAVLGVRTVASDAIRKVHHEPDDTELFESIVPASASGPTLCLLEVARLMQLGQTWCEQAQLTLTAPVTADVPQTQMPMGDSTTQRFAVFRIGQERWAVPVNAVERVVPVPDIELALRSGSHSWAIAQSQGRKLALVDISEGRRASNREAAPWMVLLNQGPLLLGLTVSECLHFLDLPQSALASMPNDTLLAGVAFSQDGTKHQVLDVAKLFALTPEASISGNGSGATGSQGATPQSEETEPSPYLVFDAGQRYASPVEGVLGVVELSSQAREDLRSGRSAFMTWRGQTIRVVNLPAIAKPVVHTPLLLAVIVQAPGDMVQPIGIAVNGLTDWLPAHSARRSGMCMGALGEFGLINANGTVKHANLVVVDLAQMAHMLG